MVRKAILVLMMFLLCTSYSITVLAANADTEGPFLDVSPERQAFALENIELGLLDEVQGLPPIACFAVNEHGDVALGFDTGPKNTVYLYSIDGDFLRGYEFAANGSFGLSFQGDRLVIYRCRSDLLLFVDENAICVEMKEVPSTENREWIQNVLYGAHIEKNGASYSLERDFGIFERSYSRCVVTLPDGEERTIYDVTVDHNIGMIIGAVAVVGFLAFWVVGFIKQEKRNGRT